MSTPLRGRRLDPDARREEIVAGALRLFTEHPYAAVSTTDLAGEAGVARGLINHYFGTKRALYLEVVRRLTTIPEVAVSELPPGTVDVRAGAAVDWFLDAVERHRGPVALGRHRGGRGHRRRRDPGRGRRDRRRPRPRGPGPRRARRPVPGARAVVLRPGALGLPGVAGARHARPRRHPRAARRRPAGGPAARRAPWSLGQSGLTVPVGGCTIVIHRRHQGRGGARG